MWSIMHQQALVRTPCFSAVACQRWVKHCLPLFWLCTLKDSSSRVRHWSSPYLVLLPRLCPCSQWYCPMALKPSSRRTWEDPFRCSWNPLKKARQCLVALAVFWTAYAIDPHSAFSCFTLKFLSVRLSLTPLGCFAQTEGLTEEHLNDVC